MYGGAAEEFNQRRIYFNDAAISRFTPPYVEISSGGGGGGGGGFDGGRGGGGFPGGVVDVRTDGEEEEFQNDDDGEVGEDEIHAPLGPLEQQTSAVPTGTSVEFTCVSEAPAVWIKLGERESRLSEEKTGRPRAICGQRHLLPCFE